MLVLGTAALKGCLFPLLPLERGVFFQYFFWKGGLFQYFCWKGVLIFTISFWKGVYFQGQESEGHILLQNVYFNAYGKGLFL